MDPSLDFFPEWGYDGSSTNQADGEDSDLILKPAFFCKDPVRGGDNYLVLCEVFNPDGKTAHSTNQRAKLRELMQNGGGSKFEPWIGFSKNIHLFKTMSFRSETGYPVPQGPFYCSVELMLTGEDC